MRVKYFKEAVSKFVLLSSIGGVGFYFGRRTTDHVGSQITAVLIEK